LVAIPILMGHLNCEPWLESNHDAYQLLDTYMGQQLQAPILQAAIICEENALDILHEFQFESSASISSNSLFSSAALSEPSQQKSLKRKMG
jgi:hypothetical protein